LEAENLIIKATASRGDQDAEFNNLNDYCDNGDKGCYGGYYYVEPNAGPAYILTITVTLKKDNQDISVFTINENISSIPTPPTITTNSITSITSNSAKCGGYIINDGGSTVIARGVCWSTSQNPTINNCKTSDGTGTGSFTSDLTGLNVGNTYYIRAYATNLAGAAYGNEISFVTLSTNCFSGLPSPVILFQGSSDYSGSDGNKYTRYELDVTNYSLFPDELFEKAPDLPACGLNTNSARTWVHIYDNNNNYLYGFCALGESKDLNQIWFALPKGQTPPSGVYIKLIDRRCDVTYTSNQLNIPTETCFSDLPSPILVFERKYEYTGSNGNLFTSYELDVTNYACFPDELFEKAPDLPACGLNTNSARTWVNIYDNNNKYLYGFCALGEPKNLNLIWFALPKGQAPPAGVYIELIDRKCDSTYTSNIINIP
jgi:hypothetical protein